MDGLTHSPGVDELIAEYHAVLPPELFEDETDQLLAALLMELKAQRIASGDSTESVDVIIEQQRKDHADGSNATRGTYHAEEVETDASEWYKVDLEFTASQIDLRNIAGGIRVAFANPEGENNVIEYDQNDDVVLGIDVQTNKLWFRSQEGEGTQTFNVEAWV